MSEEDKYLKADEKTRTIETKDGRRYVFSNRAAGLLGCTLSELEKGIRSPEELAKLNRLIFRGGDYKISIKADDKGAYNYVQIRRESQQLSVVSLDSVEPQAKINSKIEAGEARPAHIDETIEDDAEIADLAVNLCEGASKRTTNNNKDTREIDLNAIMQQTRDLGKETNRQTDEEN